MAAGGLDSGEKKEDDGLTEENERKKECLGQYRSHVRRISRIEAELEEIRAMKASHSAVNDGMPHGGCQNDLSGYASTLDELERSLLEERYHRIVTYKYISTQIKKLRSENEKDVLFYRYIKGSNWWEIAEKMGCSERWVLKIHGRALENLKIEKEFIEIQ